MIKYSYQEGGAYMDMREQVINNVMLAMQKLIAVEVYNALQDVLSVELNKYELTERCTEVATVDNSADNLLKTFAVVKSLEGIADTTIDRYMRENKKLLDFLNIKF